MPRPGIPTREFWTWPRSLLEASGGHSRPAQRQQCIRLWPYSATVGGSETWKPVADSGFTAVAGLLLRMVNTLSGESALTQLKPTVRKRIPGLLEGVFSPSARGPPVRSLAGAATPWFAECPQPQALCVCSRGRVPHPPPPQLTLPQKWIFYSKRGFCLRPIVPHGGRQMTPWPKLRPLPVSAPTELLRLSRGSRIWLWMTEPCRGPGRTGGFTTETGDSCHPPLLLDLD